MAGGKDGCFQWFGGWAGDRCGGSMGCSRCIIPSQYIANTAEITEDEKGNQDERSSKNKPQPVIRTDTQIEKDSERDKDRYGQVDQEYKQPLRPKVRDAGAQCDGAGNRRQQWEGITRTLPSTPE